MAVVSRREAASGTLTMLDVPLKVSAFPNLPDVVQVAFETVPRLLLPEPSLTAVPVPSSKLYEATNPVVCACAAVPKQIASMNSSTKRRTVAVGFARNPERGTNNLPINVSQTRWEMGNASGTAVQAHYPAECSLISPKPLGSVS